MYVYHTIAIPPMSLGCVTLFRARFSDGGEGEGMLISGLRILYAMVDALWRVCGGTDRVGFYTTWGCEWGCGCGCGWFVVVEKGVGFRLKEKRRGRGRTWGGVGIFVAMD